MPQQAEGMCPEPALEWGSAADWVSATSAFAQVVIAAVAVVLALRANRINHGAIFLARLMDELLELQLEAKQVRCLYAALFVPFTSIDDKRRARTDWVKAREAVAEKLDRLVEAFPEVRLVCEAWSTVEDEEDSHAANDAVQCTSGRKAIGRYDKVSKKFSAAVSTCIKDLRKRAHA